MDWPSGKNMAWVVVGVVAVVGTVCASQRLLNSSSPLSPEENAATAATVAYADALIADDVSTAYRLTCAKIQKGMTLTAFDEYQSDRDQISRYELLDTHLSSGSGGVVETQMFMTTGATFRQNIAVIKENGEWRVCE